jgi:hypothetical protein
MAAPAESLKLQSIPKSSTLYVKTAADNGTNGAATAAANSSENAGASAASATTLPGLNSDQSQELAELMLRLKLEQSTAANSVNASAQSGASHPVVTFSTAASEATGPSSSNGSHGSTVSTIARNPVTGQDTTIAQRPMTGADLDEAFKAADEGRCVFQ